MTAQDLGPLDWRIAIVDKTGRPTPEFQRRWAIQRNNNALIGSISFGTGAPTSADPEEGAEYVNISSVPYILYVGHDGAWHQVGVDTFLQLADTPVSYAGQGGKYVAVNTGATGLTFITPPISASGSGVPGFPGEDGQDGERGPPGPQGPIGPAGASALPGLSIVQSSVNAHNVTDGTTVEIHLTNTPTVGNLLIFACLLYDANGAPSTPTGLTQDTGIDNGVYYQTLLYRYVQAGDGKNWQLDNSGRNYWSAVAWEISNVKGTWATDHVATHVGLAGAYPSTSGSITGFNTVNANEMLLGFWGGNCGSGGMTSTITQASQTDDGQFNGTDGALCYAHANHVTLVSTAVTSVSASLSITQNADISYVYVEMASSGGGSVGPQGPSGPMGPPGQDGEDGADGRPGTVGLQGPQGIQGFALMGMSGQDGEDGADGRPGTNGTNGTNGATGAQGLRGSPGSDGQDGEDGYGYQPISGYLPLTGGSLSGPLSAPGPLTVQGTGGALQKLVGQRTDASLSTNYNALYLAGQGPNSAGTQIECAHIGINLRVPTAGSEEGEIQFFTYHGGAITIDFTIDNGNLYTGTSTSAANLVIDSLQNFYGQPAHGYSRQTPGNGFSITIGPGVAYLILKPTGALLTGTITMPAAPVDGQEIGISSTQAVTTLTVQGNSGQTLDGALTSFTANGFAKWKYVLADTTWYRVG